MASSRSTCSKNQIFRYIRLTELIPELMDMVDEKKIALNPAYELSFLKKDEPKTSLDFFPKSFPTWEQFSLLGLPACLFMASSFILAAQSQ